MIETLNGIYETVNCKQSTTLKLYDNDENENYPTHWHPAIEIIMPVENWYKIETNGTVVNLKEGDIAFICPGCTHALFAPEKGRRIIFQPNTTYLGFMRDIEVLISVMSPYTVITEETHGDIYPSIKRLLLDIRDLYFDEPNFSEVEIYNKFLEMMILIGRKHAKLVEETPAVKKGKQEEYVGKFMEICEYINEHCAENLNLDDIAARSGFSKFYFERLFKQFTGQSFYKYVNQKRITKAEQLLVDPQNSVTDVALCCGFSSMSSFIRMFKLVKGCTPTEFKNMYWYIGANLTGDEKKQRKW